MSTSILAPSDSPVNTEVKTIELSGRPYEVWAEAGRYYVHSVLTDKVARLETRESFDGFMTNLKQRLAVQS